MRKRALVWLTVLLFAVVFLFAACSPHEHIYNEWGVETPLSCTGKGTRTRSCECGAMERQPIESYTATEIYERYARLVGEIVVHDQNGNERALGSCFLYKKDGEIVTNYHVIEYGYTAEVTLDGVCYPVEQVLAYDKDMDIAILKIDASERDCANICKTEHRVGEKVYAIGSSKGMTATFSDGMITYAMREIDGISYMQHDAPCSTGNSGGPLINEYGEVIGINTWGIRDSQNLNFAIHVSELAKLSYGIPMTMQEYYEKEYTVYAKLKNYIIEAGDFYEEVELYMLTLGVNYSSGYTSKYERRAYYFPDIDCVTLDLVVNDGEYRVYFEVNENSDGIYYWLYYDVNGYGMEGRIFAKLFKKESLLSYSNSNIYNSSTEDSIRELASILVSMLCSSITHDYADVGITAKDLQFDHFD